MRRSALLAFVAAVGLAACGGESPEPAPQADATTETHAAETAPATTATEAATTTGGETAKKPTALPGLPAFTAGYRRWTRIAENLPPRDSDPHLGTKNVFASRMPKDGAFPVGTIIVKEAVRPDKDFIGLIATMRKLKGADPEHNDWLFVEWTRESAGEPFTETASGAVCWNCHVGAQKTDYSFVLGGEFG